MTQTAAPGAGHTGAARPGRTTAGPQVTLRRGSVTGALAVMFLVLLAGHLAGLWARFSRGWPADTPWISFLGFDNEANLPTWFSTILFVLAAVLLGVIARWRRREGDPFARHWTALALLFVFLSVDEACTVHERLNDVPALQQALSPSGALYYPWVAVYLVLAALLALGYARFLRALPRRTAAAFLVAGLLYAGGAVGLEMIGAAYDERYGRDNLGYAAVSTFEETLEMLGAILLIRTLLAYPAKASGGSPLRLQLGSDPE